MRGSKSMPCKQVLLAFEFRRGRRRLRAACAHDRCAPLLRHHHHRNRQHQRHNHDMSDDNGENDHRMIVIGERAIDLRCIWQVLDGRTKPCAVRSVMAGRSLDTVRSLGWQGEALDGRTKPCAVRSVMSGRSLATSQTDLKISCQCDRGLLRIWLCAVAAQPVVPAHDACWMCAAARANQRPTTTISEPTRESPAGLASASARAPAGRTPTTWPSFFSRGGVGHREAARGARRGCAGHRCRGRWSSETAPRPPAQSDAAEETGGNLPVGRRGTREKT